MLRRIRIAGQRGDVVGACVRHIHHDHEIRMPETGDQVGVPGQFPRTQAGSPMRLQDWRDGRNLSAAAAATHTPMRRGLRQAPLHSAVPGQAHALSLMSVAGHGGARRRGGTQLLEYLAVVLVKRRPVRTGLEVAGVQPAQCTSAPVLDWWQANMAAPWSGPTLRSSGQRAREGGEDEGQGRACLCRVRVSRGSRVQGPARAPAVRARRVPRACGGPERCAAA
ncbi:hypothetical protein SAMN05518854_114151 [Variovorax sp. YR266]|nr:hypothetical protein SAMN05518854_114151 [Variovorax sp. YR266]